MPAGEHDEHKRSDENDETQFGQRTHIRLVSSGDKRFRNDNGKQRHANKGVENGENREATQMGCSRQHKNEEEHEHDYEDPTKPPMDLA